jgi:DNA repair protein RadC
MNNLSQVPTPALLALVTGATEAEAQRWLDYGWPVLGCGEALAEYGASAPFAKAAHILAAARELVQRWLEQDLRERPVLSSPNAMRDYLRVRLADRPHEVFMVLYLDAQNRLIEAEELFRGTLTQTSVYPREVVKGALAPGRNAASVALVHNHPSGNCHASAADKMLTQTLKQALALVDVKVLDHFLVGGNEVVSFAELGLL